MAERKKRGNKSRSKSGKEGKLVQLVFDREELEWLEQLRSAMRCSTLRGTVRLALSCILKLTGITDDGRGGE